MRKRLLILGAAVMTLAPMSASATVRGFVVVGRPYYVMAAGMPLTGGRIGDHIGVPVTTTDIRTRVKSSWIPK